MEIIPWNWTHLTTYQQRKIKGPNLRTVLLFLELLLDRWHPSRVTAEYNEYLNLELPGDWANPDSSGVGLFNTNI
jgi:hypothetical protein